MSERLCYIGMGSNLGHRKGHLLRGLAGLSSRGLTPLAISSVWETEPVGSDSPNWYWNMAVSVETDWSPERVLALLLSVERGAGRARGEPNADRTLDLDLLMVGDLEVDDRDLRLPHPRMWERRFVLAPLAEIAPDLRNPGNGQTTVESCNELNGAARVRMLGSLATCSDLLL